MRVTSERLFYLAVAFACLTVGANAALQVANTFWPGLLPRAAQTGAQAASSAASRVPETYGPGDLVPSIADYSYQSATATLVLAVRSTCPYCTESMPFYRQLADSVRGTGGKVKLLAVSTEPATTVVDYFKAHAVDIEVVRTVPEGQLVIPGTPTLLLVDSEGRVRDRWVGMQPREQEEVILAAITKPS